MIQRRIRICLPLCLALPVLLLLLAGCRGVSPAPADSPAPVERSDYGTVRALLQSVPHMRYDEDAPVIRALVQASGVDLQVTTVAPSRYESTLLTALSAEQAYDLVELTSAQARNTADQLQGVALPDIDQYPAYATFVHGFNDLWARLAVDGRVYSLPFCWRSAGATGAWLVRADYLRQSGLDAPGNFAQFEQLLAYLAQREQCRVPLLVRGGVQGVCAAFAPCFGTQAWFVQTEQGIAFGPGSEPFRTMLRALAQLYAQGLLDYNFYGRSTDAAEAQFAAGAVGATFAGDYDLLRLFEKDTYTTVPPPVAEGITQAQYPGAGLPQRYVSIPAHSGQKEAVLRLLDYAFSGEGTHLHNQGLVGQHSVRSLFAHQYNPDLTPYELLNAGLFNPYVPGVTGDLSAALSDIQRLNTIRNTAPATPATPKTLQAERLEGALLPTCQYWWRDFITGQADLDTQWQAYLDALHAAGMPKLGTLIAQEIQ